MTTTTTTTTTPAADYISMEGDRVTMRVIASYASCIREDLEELKAENPSLAEKLDLTLETLNCIDPDLDACPAPPTHEEQLRDARWLLQRAVVDAQDLLRTESTRQRKEEVMQEAFTIPAATLYGLLKAAFDAAGVEYAEGAFKAAEQKLEGYGWEVYGHMGEANLGYIRTRAPLRKLATLIDRYPRSPLTDHTLAVLHFSSRWCENTSHNFPSPISGKADGQAPDGVLYPRISMELHPFKSYRDIPKEWKEPLVSKEVAEVAEGHE